ncbi:MAG TPA: hypothetical protein VH796_07520 [Nitrososphaeraceae archaeon]
MICIGSYNKHTDVPLCTCNVEKLRSWTFFEDFMGDIRDLTWNLSQNYPPVYNNTTSQTY